MYIDKDNVQIGDKLYDWVARTYVTVAAMRGDDLHVRYPDGATHIFTGAVFNGVRRLYWHNPIVHLPRRSDTVLLGKLARIAEVLSE